MSKLYAIYQYLHWTQPRYTLLEFHAFEVQYVGLENPQHLEKVRQFLDYFEYLKILSGKDILMLKIKLVVRRSNNDESHLEMSSILDFE